MGFLSELLRLKSYVEAHLYFYLLDRFPELKNGESCILYKTLSVTTPFGKKDSRDQNGRSQIKPEICVTCNRFGFAAEAAAWDDDSNSGNTQSEAHQSMHQIGLEPSLVYFAQKVICQVLPAFLYCKETATEVYAFISFTENHKCKMENVLSHLKCKGFIKSFERPLGSNSRDIQRYKQVIYELKFFEPEKEIVNRILCLAGYNAEPSGGEGPGIPRR